MHLLRLRSSRVLGWLAAALAAAAAVWLPLAILFAEGLAEKVEWALGGLVLLVPYAAVTGGATRVAYAVGTALGAGALFLAWILFLVAGSCQDDGHVTPAMWTVGAIAYLGAGAWSLQRPKRAFLGLPLSVLLGAVVVVLLSTAFTGSTGACLS